TRTRPDRVGVNAPGVCGTQNRLTIYHLCRLPALGFASPAFLERLLRSRLAVDPHASRVHVFSSRGTVHQESDACLGRHALRFVLDQTTSRNQAGQSPSMRVLGPSSI